MKIGFVGLGIMGRPMALNLKNGGHDLLVPERATDLHLQLLGELAQMFSDRTFREQLQASSDPVVIHQLFINWKA